MMRQAGTAMKFSSIKTMPKNVVRDTMKSIERNNLMSAASVLSVIAALIILGIFLILTINVQEVTKDVESKLELKIFLQSDFTDTQKETIEQALEKSDLIENVSFESAEEALEKFTVSLEDYAPLLSGYNSENNPMPASFVVRVTDPNDMEEVQTLAMSFEGEGVEYVRYGQEYVEALVSFNKFTNTLSIVVLVVLSMISIFIIYNTIKLTVFARRREIGIMKYVGATNAYILHFGRNPVGVNGSHCGLPDYPHHLLLYFRSSWWESLSASGCQSGFPGCSDGTIDIFLLALWRIYRSSRQCICDSQILGRIND
jgi:cell division transport system permease protein